MHQLFRFVNITFTTAALAIAIRIRRTEERNNVTGILGSSPYVVACDLFSHTLD
jgi:hypothetical protein